MSIQTQLAIIKHLITYTQKDTWGNHLTTMFGHDRREYRGESREDGFSVWRYSGMIGIFYPVVRGKVISKENEQQILLKSRLNRVATVLVAVGAILLAYGLWDGVVMQPEKDPQFSWARLWLGMGLASLFYAGMGLPMYLVARKEKANLRRFLEG